MILGRGRVISDLISPTQTCKILYGVRRYYREEILAAIVVHYILFDGLEIIY